MCRCISVVTGERDGSVGTYTAYTEHNVLAKHRFFCFLTYFFHSFNNFFFVYSCTFFCCVFFCYIPLSTFSVINDVGIAHFDSTNLLHCIHKRLFHNIYDGVYTYNNICAPIQFYIVVWKIIRVGTCMADIWWWFFVWWKTGQSFIRYVQSTARPFSQSSRNILNRI